MKKSRFDKARIALIVITMFVGIGAVGGAACMLVDPSGKLMGMDAMLPYFTKLPFADVLFTNFVFSGISLLVVNGLTNLTAAALLFAKRKSGAVLGGVFGVTLMLWICIQFYFLPFNFMSIAFFVIGVCQAVVGYAACVFYKQEHFVVDESKYGNVGKNPKRLVVYFSRMGYVKKQAYERADATGAEVYEIKSTEVTQGTKGFWWCGRFAMHRWAMPIEPIAVDLTKYEHVTICSPIWVFELSAPVREFCKQARGKIASADYILVHHTNGAYTNVADEMDEMLDVKRTSLLSVRCRTGSFTKVYDDNDKEDNVD